MINKEYKIELEVITPLHIGSGVDLVQDIDFVKDGNKIYVLNHKKISKRIENGVDILCNFFEQKGSISLNKYLGNKLDDVSDKVFDSNFNSNDDINNDIKSIVKNQLTGNPIIPGSSIKGAISSIILNFLGEGKNIDKDTIKKLFGSVVDGKNIMRFIKFSDLEFSDTCLVNSKIFNLHKPDRNWEGGWKNKQKRTDSKFMPNGFNTIYEVIEPGKKNIGRLVLTDKDSFLVKENINEEKKKDLLVIHDLFSIINSFTKKYLIKERDFFNKFPTDKTDNIINSIDSILNQIPDDNSYCIFKMSAGSGFHTITGDWKFDNYTEGNLGRRTDSEAKPKSRKIAIYGKEFSLMGFVKIKALSDEDIRQYALLEIEKKKEEARREEEKLKLIEEKKKAIEIREQTRIEYLGLIKKAKSLLDNNDYSEAKEIIDLAEEKSNGTLEHKDIQKEIDFKLEKLEKEKNAEKAREELNRIKKETYNAPLSQRLSPANTLKSVFSVTRQWMKQNNKNSISDKEIEELTNKLTYLYNNFSPRDKKQYSNPQKWKDLCDLIGDEKTEDFLRNLAI